MPDPPQAGADWEYEWIEVTNVGSGVASLRGMALRDRQSTIPLPADQDVQVAPGASAIIAGPRAEVDADVRLAGPIGNGLGNQGDALELLDASGQPVDVLEYGAGTRWAAPLVAFSIHRWFDEAGILAGRGNGRPTPGEDAGLCPLLWSRQVAQPMYQRQPSSRWPTRPVGKCPRKLRW